MSLPSPGCKAQRRFWALLGGSWVAISGVIRLLIWVISIVTLRITRLISTHEPPGRVKSAL